MGKVIGIDLGTTNSCVALLEGGKPIVVPNTEGGRTTPSVVSFSKGDKRLIGQLAKRQAVTNPENTIYSIKRFIGRRWEETEMDRARVPYHCLKGQDDTVGVEIRGQQFTPEEIAAAILQKLKADAEAFLGETINEAVITVPAYFTDGQRQATKNAGTIAGLEVKRIINEPTAAALAYGLDKLTQDQLVLVFDLGGGTFDVSLLQLGNGIFEVLATAGNSQLGGDDFDNALVNWLVETFKEREGIDLFEDSMARQRLREAAEKAKIELSNLQTTSINLPFIAADDNGPKHLEIELNRAKFEELTKDLVSATLDPVNQALKDSELTPDDIDRIILVGGSTRIPAVQRLIQRLFPNTQIERSLNPDEAVALGAAIQGGVIGGEVQDMLLLDVTPLSLGIETLGEVFTKVIERNTTIPTSRFQTFSTASDGQTSVEIHVLQGERAMAKDNISLGKFLLTGIPPAPRGIPQIEVTFEIDVNGILRVAAEDQGTGRQQSIVISNRGGLSSSDIERLQQEAEQYAESDRLERERADLDNQAYELFDSYATVLRENGHLISESLKLNSRQKQEQLSAALQDPKASLPQLRTMLEELRQAILQIGTEVYEKGSRKSADSDSPPSEPTSGTEIKELTPTDEIRQNAQTWEFDFQTEDDVSKDYEVID